MNLIEFAVKEESKKNQPGKINEGQERGNNKIVTTPKPIIQPAPQKPPKK